jgi:ribosomal protein S18 acetylase RimI-like enzyme
MANIVVRVAKLDDRKRVLAFTSSTFSWGDYIERVFDRWLNDKSGRLLVAESEDKVVGLSFVKLTKKGEAWLQGGRVDQNYRRAGIGEAMTKECLRIAKEEMNATIARVITDKTNLPPQKLLTKLGFRVVSEFSEFEKKAEPIKNPLLTRDVRLAEKGLIPDMWRYLRRSPIFRKSCGLYTVWFVWYSLEKEDLARFVQDRKAVVYTPGGRIHGVMLVNDSTIEAKNEKSIQSCYFDSDASEGVQALSSFLLDHAAKKGFKTVRLWTCSDSEIIESLRQTGFAGEVDESTEIVYSKEL